MFDRKKRSCRILLVGCGELGSRHLQAVAQLPQIEEIEVVDPRPQGLALGKRRLEELVEWNRKIQFRWIAALEEASLGGDLCLVATQAQERPQLIQEVAARLGYSQFLIEKIVAQSVPEMEELIAQGRRRSLSIWVNLKTRAYPIHQRIKAMLDPSEPVVMAVTAGNLGLANNGVHTVDLFVYYDGSQKLEGCGGWIDAVLHPSKRGKDLFDLSGTLQGRSDKGSSFTLSYNANSQAPELISVTTQGKRFLVDHFCRWAMASRRDEGWQWKPIPFEGNLLVSEMTKGFVQDILCHGRCALPTLEESFPAHRFILEELKPHFGGLLKKELQECPVT